MNDTRRGVLARLKEDPISGPTLAEELGVSRTAVWNQIEAVREEGFEIETRTDGYTITDVPEYGASAVEYYLDGGFAVEYHETIKSTNGRARDLGRDGATDVVVLADEQTSGRGRLDRAWTAPSGGIWMSLLLCPDLPPARVPLLTLAAAIATARALRARGIDAGLKWPNDVLATSDDGTERKLAGILTEMEGEADAVSWVVVGIGLNANIDAGKLPGEATSLRERVGGVDRARLVADLLKAFDALRMNTSEILPAWRDLSLTLGRRVHVETSEESIVGEAVGVESPGRLRVDTGENEVWVLAGDCEHLRQRDP